MSLVYFPLFPRETEPNPPDLDDLFDAAYYTFDYLADAPRPRNIHRINDEEAEPILETFTHDVHRQRYERYGSFVVRLPKSGVIGLHSKVNGEVRRFSSSGFSFTLAVLEGADSNDYDFVADRLIFHTSGTPQAGDHLVTRMTPKDSDELMSVGGTLDDAGIDNLYQTVTSLRQTGKMPSTAGATVLRPAFGREAQD